MTKITVFGQKFYIKLLRAPRFKKPYTLMPLLPWDKLREHLAGLRPAQRKAVKNFTAVADATGGLNLADRMEIIRKVLQGKDYGGKKLPYPYPRLSPAELEAKIEEVKRLIA